LNELPDADCDPESEDGEKMSFVLQGYDEIFLAGYVSMLVMSGIRLVILKAS
jgi:hypothetical protein